MKDVFDISEAVNEAAAAYLEETGLAPVRCCVSPDIYRMLVEQNAAQHDIGNLLIASRPVTSILTDTAQLRVIIDESLHDCELSVE